MDEAGFEIEKFEGGRKRLGLETSKISGERERDRERQTDRQTDRQRQRTWALKNSENYIDHELKVVSSLFLKFSKLQF